jgi:hypothetical protein
MTSTVPTETSIELESDMAQRGREGRVRPLSERDVPQLLELHQRLGPDKSRVSPPLLNRILFELPWSDAALPSLAYEDDRGRILGSLGVMPRRMKFRGENIRAAVAHHFIVDPSRKGTRAGVELARKFLRGPQDLSLAEGSESSRRIWEFLGGSASLLYSLCWTRPLRPAQFALYRSNQNGLTAASSFPFTAIGQVMDAALQVLPRNAYQVQRPAVLSDELDTVTMLAFLSAFFDRRSLQPIYDFSSLTWMIEFLEQKRHRGTLHKVAVRAPSGRPLGWYLYYLASDGIADVIQLGGCPEWMSEVVNHLFHHAWQRGAIAATGLMESRYCDVLAQNHCTFHRPDKWLLIHAWDQQIVNRVNAGDAFLSRLEGEWWISS